jgi:hypothetical protein
MVDADAIRAAGQIEPALRLDAGADREHEQRVAARVGHVAPRPRAAVIGAGHVRWSDARGSSSQDPAARVAQLDDPLAAEQDHAAPARQRGDVARRPLRRGQLGDVGRAAACKHGDRGGGHCAQRGPSAGDERGAVI